MPFEKVALVPVGPRYLTCFLTIYARRARVGGGSHAGRDTHASDEAYAAASTAFASKDLVDLTITIAAMNAFNRLGAPFRLPVQAQI